MGGESQPSVGSEAASDAQGIIGETPQGGGSQPSLRAADNAPYVK